MSEPVPAKSRRRMEPSSSPLSPGPTGDGRGWAVIAYERLAPDRPLDTPPTVLCLGVYERYLNALDTLRAIPRYRNAVGDELFSGGFVLRLPRRNLPPSSQEWRFYRVSEFHPPGHEVRPDGSIAP